MIRALENAELWWEPGTKIGYHAYTFGYLAGEIVRRSTGRPFAEVLRERIAAPLGFPDELFFGMPEDKRGSLVTLVDAPSEVDWSTMQLLEDLPMFRAAPMSLFPNADLGNDPGVVGADIPAGGKTSARAIAKMYAALLAGQRPSAHQPRRARAGSNPSGRRQRRGVRQPGALDSGVCAGRTFG